MKEKRLNEYSIDGDFAYIHLGDGISAIIDKSDIIWCKAYTWYLKTIKKKDKNYIYVTTSYCSFVDGNRVQRNVFLSRHIMKNPARVIKHIDGNSLNCSKVNLRIV